MFNDYKEELTKAVKKYGIWFLLFLSLLAFMLNGYEKREAALINYLDKQAEINMKVAQTLERIDVRLCTLERSVK
jgi:hypothetical protein